MAGCIYSIGIEHPHWRFGLHEYMRIGAVASFSLLMKEPEFQVLLSRQNV